MGGRSNSFRAWLSNRAEGDWDCVLSSSSKLAKLLRRDRSGLLKLFPKMPMPRAKELCFGRVLEGGLNGDEGTASDWRMSLDLSKGPSDGVGLDSAENKLIGRLHGVSGMFLLDPNEFWGSSALRFFLEIRPVDMNAAGRGLTSL